MNKFKVCLLSFENMNITVICLFDIVIKNSIIKFFMIFILLSFINFIQNNIDIYKSTIIERILYSKIYESFMILPLIRFFYLLSENIFNRHTILLDKEIIYKNFYLINLEENDTNIFSFSNLHDALNTKKIHKNKILWNELLFHSKKLKNYYLIRLGRISDKEYENLFVKIEYKSTWPNLIYVIRFLPILNGIALIHEYELNKKTKDKDITIKSEFEIKYWNDIYIDKEKERCINEPKIIKERESFIYGFFNSGIPYLYFFYESKLNTYYSKEIINIINKIIETTDFESSLNFNYVLSKILDYLYNEYLKKIINNLEKQNLIQENKFKSQEIIIKRNLKLIDKINENKHEIVNNNQWNYSNFYHNQNLFKMNEINYLLFLFKPTENISRYKYKKNEINENDYNKNNNKDKYDYINIDLKKSFHKSINLTMKFSSYEDNNNLTTKENPSIKNKSESLNQILSKPLSNYDGQLNFDSFQSTKNISSDFNKSQSQGEEDTFFSLKNSSFGLESSFSIKSSNNIINK